MTPARPRFKTWESPAVFTSLALALAQSLGAQASFKYPGCSDVSASSFKAVTLVDKTIDPTLVDPIRFAVTKSGDLYYINRDGSVKLKKASGSIVDMGKIPVTPLLQSNGQRVKLSSGDENEFGLTGFVLDPAFETNHFMYVHYQKQNPDELHISRFTVVSDKLDLTSEKILISHPWQFEFCCHSGGDMRFDRSGNLWVSIGNNTRNPAATEANGYVDESNAKADDQGHAANTNDLRGKILRIHPTPEGTYTIPAGNLKDVYASLWSAADLAKVRPEIYTMGHRNPYTLSIDPLKGWLVWGEVGPDNGYLSEEFNLTDKPGNFGWPYFAGNANNNPNYSYRMNKDANGPTNTSPNNTGVQKLPPAIPALIGYRQSCAMSGPIYRYAAYPDSPKKIPPHFDGKWFATDFDVGWLKVFGISADGKSITDSAKLLGDQTLYKPIHVNIGEDGILYTLTYGRDYWAALTPDTKIVRWEFQGGNCTGPIAVENQLKSKPANLSQWISFGANGSREVSLPVGAHSVALFDLKGKQVWQTQIFGATRLSLPSTFANGLYRAKIHF